MYRHTSGEPILFITGFDEPDGDFTPKPAAHHREGLHFIRTSVCIFGITSVKIPNRLDH